VYVVTFLNGKWQTGSVVIVLINVCFLCEIASNKKLPSSYIWLTYDCLIISFIQAILLFMCSGLIANQQGKMLNQQVINGDRQHVPIKFVITPL
jgi:hypothetical protein